MAPGFHATFSSLGNRNLRLYLIAQIGSSVGAWIQITAENWLVLQLSPSGLALGITNALQFGPLVVFGLYGGVIADRLDRRRLLIVTQSVLALLAAAVGLVITHRIELWMIWLAALLLGLVMCLDRPALLAFVKDLAFAWPPPWQRVGASRFAGGRPSGAEPGRCRSPDPSRRRPGRRGT